METIYLLLAVLGGVGIRLLVKWVSALRGKRAFKVKLAMAAALLSVATNFALVFVRADLISFVEQVPMLAPMVLFILPTTTAAALVCGYIGDSLFRGIIKVSKPDFDKKD